MRRFGTPLIFLAGAALSVILAVHAGIGGIAKTIAAIGWGRLTLICLLQLGSIALCAVAWWCVARFSKLRTCFLARWIRDGASNLIGFVPIIGETISARALTVFGGRGAGEAAASTLVDVSIEALAQALYTVLGLFLLLAYLEGAEIGRWLLIVGVGVIPVVALFVASRYRPALELAEKWGARLAGWVGLGSGVSTLKVAETVRSIYGMHGRVAAGFVVHLLAWAVGAVQVWAAAQALDHPVSFGGCLALESLVYAARSAFFLVPMAAGVQEGGFLLVGEALGVAAPDAIALSLILRVRDLIIGAPAVLIWSAAEARRLASRPGLLG